MEKLPMPVLNGKYSMLSTLGEGNTSKVYLAQTIEEPRQFVAVKILRDEFLARDADARKAVVNEVVILQTLKHPHIIKILEFGDDGQVLKPSGRSLTGLVYIVLELVQGGLLFDVCQLVGGLGEDGGRYFFKQMLRAIEYMSAMKVAHRDLKLENILVDNDLSLKIADFGYAAFNKVDALSSYRGTFTYMAPEIKEGRSYNGLQVDLFSAGVVLFILVRGIFPFKEARKDEFFYSLLVQGAFAEYWEKVQGTYLSDACRDLLQRLFAYDPTARPSLAEVWAHPWLSDTHAPDSEVKAQIVAMIQQAKDETAQQRAKARGAAQKKAKVARGDEEDLEVVSAKPYVPAYKFNHFGEFLTEASPAAVLSALDSYRAEANPELILRSETKGIAIEDPARGLALRLKFFRADAEDRVRARFLKKRGAVEDEYALISDLLVYLNELIIDEDDNE